MRRRDFIAGMAGSASAWPIVARAQPSGKLPVIGYMGQGTAAAEAKRVAAFFGRLHELSWIEGRTVIIEYRWTNGRSDLAARKSLNPSSRGRRRRRSPASRR